MADIYRKRCGQCGATYEWRAGRGTEEIRSCEQCGAGLGQPPEVVSQDNASGPMPRSGGEGTITHTRDNF